MSAESLNCAAASRPRLAPPGLLALTALTAALVAALLASLAFAGAALGADLCAEAGSGAGQCLNPEGVATDLESELVYVTEVGNDRVSVFEPDGTFVLAFGWGVDTGAQELQTCTAASGCQAGIPGSGAGQFDNPRSVAVDNSAGATKGEVYVGTDSFRVQRFEADGTFVSAFGTEGKGECQIARESDAIAVGPGGDVFIADAWMIGTREFEGFNSRVEKFSPSGECLDETALFGPSAERPTRSVRDLAVDSAEDAYVTVEGDGGALRKFDLGADETELCEPGLDPGPPPIETNGLAIGPGDVLYAAQRERRAFSGPVHQVISAYGPSCEHLRRFGYDQIGSNLGALAHLSTGEGDVFASEANTGLVRYLAIPPPGPVVVPSGVAASPIGNAKATIKAEVNPEGKATEVRVEYLTEAAFAEQGGFEGAATLSTEPQALEVAEGREFGVNAIEFLLGCPTATKELIEEGKCLTPETEYRYRVIATSEDNPTGEGEGTVVGEAFTTKGPLEFEATWSSEVGTDVAALHARVNPLGIPTTGYFEYITEAEYQANLEAEADPFAGAAKAPNVDAEPPQAEIHFGSGEAAVPRVTTLYPLQPGTTYRYRVVATDPLVDGYLRSEAKTFRTFKPQTAEPCPANDAFRTGAAAFLPDCRAYEMVSPLDKEGGEIKVQPQGTTNLPATLDQAAVSGSRLTYGSYRAFAGPESAPYTSQYLAERGAGGWASHSISPPQDGLIRDGIELDNEFRYFSEDLCQGWLTAFAEFPEDIGQVPGYFNLYRRSDRLCGAEGFTPLSTAKPTTQVPDEYSLEAQGVSADGETVAFVANDALEGTAATAGRRELYVKEAGGPLLFACVLPDGSASESACSAGTNNGVTIGNHRQASVTNALSGDGASLYWTDATADGKIYLRQNPLEPESDRLHDAATGSGNLIGPAVGSGNLKTFLFTIGNVRMGEGSFAPGQEISGEGIEAETTITAIEETSGGIFKLTISKKPTANKTGAVIVGAASAEVSDVATDTGSFAVGQEISGPGIPPGTTVESTGAGTLTLSAAATETAAEAPLSATSPCTDPDTKACTVAVSEAGEAASGTSASHFWAAARDGSRALFTTGYLPSGAADLYEFSAEGEETNLIAGDVYGLVGAGEDAAVVYFASREVLDGEPNSRGAVAVEGEPNLYRHESGEGGGYRFIGTLSKADANPLPHGYFASSPIAVEPTKRNGRVSASGEHAAFLSTARLSGYDNTDALSGEADTEAFLYDAGADQLICASCNPSGGRPSGENVGGGTAASKFWIAARLPAYESTLYAPRVLASDGSRLYFESADPLVARDTNGKLDVYQWERAGRGGCSAARPTYSPAAKGCVDLISSGQSELDSRFVDASPSGSDVFFATLASLYPADPGLVDVYDARALGGFPAPPAPAPECEGEQCRPAPPAPRFDTPSSQTYLGPGNLEEGSGGASRCIAAARKAKRQARKAKRARRAARRSHSPARRRALRGTAKRRAKRARRRSASARRCRARGRAARRAGR